MSILNKKDRIQIFKHTEFGADTDTDNIIVIGKKKE